MTGPMHTVRHSEEQLTCLKQLTGAALKPCSCRYFPQSKPRTSAISRHESRKSGEITEEAQSAQLPVDYSLQPRCSLAWDKALCPSTQGLSIPVHLPWWRTRSYKHTGTSPRKRHNIFLINPCCHLLLGKGGQEEQEKGSNPAQGSSTQGRAETASFQRETT